MNDQVSGYNARQITSSKIAESFVVPDEFIEISKYGNSLLIGPRGAGKTTILKALTPSGIYHLKQRSDIGEELAKWEIDYLPIYIPAEKSWRGDASTVKLYVENEEIRYHILNGLFVDHCLRHLVLALEEASLIASKIGGEVVPPWALSITDECEEHFSRVFSDAWKLEKVQTSFLGLKLALIDRSNSYKNYLTRLNYNGVNNTDELLNFPRLNILEMFKVVIEAVQDRFGEKKWCFNFDEMEIAPHDVVTMLYENFRSWDQRAVLKFSLFPYVDFYSSAENISGEESAARPVEGQDFTAFVLADTFTKTSSPFVQRLVEKECSKRCLSLFDFARYLNKSNAMKTRRFKGVNFERDVERIFNNSYSQNPDNGFREWVSEKGFAGVEELLAKRGNKERAATVRKIAPIVEFRSYYLSHSRNKNGGSSGRVSHKGFGYYHGYNQIVDLTEGNPRAIKFYVNAILDSLENKESSNTAQNRIIQNNVDRFRALCASQVVPFEVGGGEFESTLGFVDKLGSIFLAEILGSKLKATAQLSCVFKNLSPPMRGVLEVAINAGALVLDNSDNPNKLVFDVEGIRMRLSHRFAPFHPLPTITGGIKKISPEQWSKHTPSKKQSDLFNWADE